jgi:hypothetical protein
MGTAGRSAPLRRSGSLLGLLGLELAAVLALHWLGRFAGLRIRWDKPVPWLLSSPVQDVLGALLRTVGLVMAYWLLVSTLLYLLASLTRLPSAVRAVGWATLPLARRVADHAVAVTLATSMVGGTTLGVAGPALASEDRGRFGPPARLPAAAAQAAGSSSQDPPSSSGETTGPSGTAYTPKPAGQVPPSGPGGTTTPTRGTTAPTEPPDGEPKPTRPSEPAYTPEPADRVPRARASTTTTTSTEPTTTTEPPTTTTAAPTTATGPPTTTTAPATTTAPTTEPTTTTTEPTTTTTEPPAGGGEPGQGGGSSKPPEADKASTHKVAGGENLWTIARDHLGASAEGGSGGPTTEEVTAYWDRLKAVNQNRLESGDPDIIEAGEKIVLPPVPTAGAGAGPAPATRERTSEPAAPGDSLWTIARDHLAAVGKGAGAPTNRQVAEYWAKVKAANRHRLQSRDPDLIEPGEKIVLPPVD